jgi:hypothetical protein
MQMRRGITILGLLNNEGQHHQDISKQQRLDDEERTRESERWIRKNKTVTVHVRTKCEGHVADLKRKRLCLRHRFYLSLYASLFYFIL